MRMLQEVEVELSTIDQDNPICPKCFGFSLVIFLPPCILCGGVGRVAVANAREYFEKILPKPREHTVVEKERLPRWIPYRYKD